MNIVFISLGNFSGIAGLYVMHTFSFIRKMQLFSRVAVHFMFPPARQVGPLKEKLLKEKLVPWGEIRRGAVTQCGMDNFYTHSAFEVLARLPP